jgi:hypothetical protein
MRFLVFSSQFIVVQLFSCKFQVAAKGCIHFTFAVSRFTNSESLSFRFHCRLPIHDCRFLLPIYEALCFVFVFYREPVSQLLSELKNRELFTTHH